MSIITVRRMLRRFRQTMREHGAGVALLLVVDRFGRWLVNAEVLKVLHLEASRVNPVLEAELGYSFRFLSAAELWKFSSDPANDLPSAIGRASSAGGELVFCGALWRPPGLVRLVCEKLDRSGKRRGNHAVISAEHGLRLPRFHPPGFSGAATKRAGHEPSAARARPPRRRRADRYDRQDELGLAKEFLSAGLHRPGPGCKDQAAPQADFHRVPRRQAARNTLWARSRLVESLLRQIPQGQFPRPRVQSKRGSKRCEAGHAGLTAASHGLRVPGCP